MKWLKSNPGHVAIPKKNKQIASLNRDSKKHQMCHRSLSIREPEQETSMEWKTLRK